MRTSPVDQPIASSRTTAKARKGPAKDPQKTQKTHFIVSEDAILRTFDHVFAYTSDAYPTSGVPCTPCCEVACKRD
jgi:hypothetical protein